MPQFHLVTRWCFDAPIERVWEMLNQPERFPEWWPGFERAEVEGDGGVGTLSRYRVRGDFGLGFDFETRVDERREPEYLLVSSRGDLTGTGEWRLERDGSGTKVVYTWDVDLGRRGLRLFSRLPGSRRRMERSHDRVMSAGGENLARLLAASPVSTASDAAGDRLPVVERRA